jgi:hypothetical protein
MKNIHFHREESSLPIAIKKRIMVRRGRGWVVWESVTRRVSGGGGGGGEVVEVADREFLDS